MRYAVVIEKSEINYAAYVPDLPGCVATGPTERNVTGKIREAMALHIESLIDHDEPVPRPTAIPTTKEALQDKECKDW